MGTITQVYSSLDHGLRPPFYQSGSNLGESKVSIGEGKQVGEQSEWKSKACEGANASGNDVIQLITRAARGNDI